MRNKEYSQGHIPFDVVSADSFNVGEKVYMIYRDRLSGYPFVNLSTKDPKHIKWSDNYNITLSLFSKPLKFKPDGGAQFDSKEMRKFYV